MGRTMNENDQLAALAVTVGLFLWVAVMVLVSGWVKRIRRAECHANGHRWFLSGVGGALECRHCGDRF